MSARLQGKVAIVTGSTEGIGAAVARLFVAEGACVVLNSDRDDAAAAAIRDELGAARSLFVQGDVADPAAMEALAAQAVARFGKVDILVNNAGINVFADPLEMTAEQWQRCFAVDLEGAWNAIRACLPGMLAQGAGSIVNIASVHGHRIIPGAFPYPVAKHALIGLTKSLGIEYAARGIRVNSVSPGRTLTSLWTQRAEKMAGERGVRPEDIIHEFSAEIPMQRFARPDEVAAMAVFLASHKASYVNCQSILVDGGIARGLI